MWKKLRPIQKNNIRKVLFITGAFLLINAYFVFYENSVLHSNFSLGPSNDYSLSISILVNFWVSIVAGVVGGFVFIWANEHVFKRRSFQFAIYTTVLCYVLVFFLVSTVAFMLTIWKNPYIPLTFSSLVGNYTEFMFTRMVLSYFLLWNGISLLTIFFLQISDLFGPGRLGRFLIGKYHEAHDEERIFMFLDMKSSTTIAERIGNSNYFKLLHRLFSSISDVIVQYNGEVYQYVGDEIIVSWDLQKGLRKANCLRCFREIQTLMEKNAESYDDSFGFRPEFKAGMHFGIVTAGEIGSIKRDIVYSGDVLNTTARIQGMCNGLGVNFLISDVLLELIPERAKFYPATMGMIELRGKQEKVGLSTLRWHDDLLLS